MKIVWASLAGLAGALVGLLLGTVGVFLCCVLYDKITYPNGAPAGGGLLAVGWIFLFITAPAGVVLGGALGVLFWLLGWRRAEKRTSQQKGLK